LDVLILGVLKGRHYYGISGHTAGSQKIEREVVGVALVEKRKTARRYSGVGNSM
jgi:hypothetical protein